MRTARFRVVTCLGLGLALASPCLAQESIENQPVRIGFSIPLTGAFAENGKQMSAALKLYTEQHGSTIAGSPSPETTSAVSRAKTSDLCRAS